jgi:hypothetical protein
MSASNKSLLTRRDFIKAAAAGISGLIGALVGIPSVVYLLSPATKARAGDDALIPLGPLENYPISIPTRFEFTRCAGYLAHPKVILELNKTTW